MGQPSLLHVLETPRGFVRVWLIAHIEHGTLTKHSLPTMISVDDHRVWAIEYETRCTTTGATDTETVTVSAESEYGAIKRLCGNRACIPKKVMLLDIEPEYAERRIEGYIANRIKDFTWPDDWPAWEYT